MDNDNDKINMYGKKSLSEYVEYLSNENLIKSSLGSYNQWMLKRYITGEKRKRKVLATRIFGEWEDAELMEGEYSSRNMYEKMLSDKDYITCIEGSCKEKLNKVEEMFNDAKSLLERYIGREMRTDVSEFKLINHRAKQAEELIAGAIYGPALGGIVVGGLNLILTGEWGLFAGALAFGGVAVLINNLLKNRNIVDASSRAIGLFSKSKNRVSVVEYLDGFNLFNCAIDSIVAHELGHAVYAESLGNKYYGRSCSLLGEGFALYVENLYNFIKAKDGNKLYLIPWFNSHCHLIDSAEKALLEAEESVEDYDYDDYYFDDNNKALAYVVCRIVDRKLKSRGTSLLQEVSDSNYYPLAGFIKNGIEGGRK